MKRDPSSLFSTALALASLSVATIVDWSSRARRWLGAAAASRHDSGGALWLAYTTREELHALAPPVRCGASDAGA